QGEVIRHLSEDLGQRGFQRSADRREKFRGRLLLAALDFGQIAQGHPGGGGHLAEGTTLAQAQPPQRVTKQVTKQDHVALPSRRGWHFHRYLPSPTPRPNPPTPPLY